jgi:sugar lactone lactonase YvrE
MVVDDSGRIWIEEYSLVTSRRAAIYSPRFELLGIVPLPPAFTIHCVRGNLVAGVVTDADGVERVEVRPLIGL